ncbi:MAG: type II toxin-antitoxin system VapC family toxin [Planctomycetaceae bacterium]|nr:type II toxin-antitoxin system VapC family toxin [Planctomycetales bacterium]MCB9924664.1 type II toxin-antitoxin system VapC family toxin [Planctomycetaceae bacterium]
MDIVYVETTVIGNIAGRLHPDANIASRQRITREWWATATSLYQIVTSRLTLDECGDGDPAAARERLDILNGIPLLNESSDAEMLAELLIERKAVPASEPRDALHIATAATNGVQFIATWNFKHILNPHLQAQIAGTCRDAGFIPPVICTPEQLKVTENDS